VNGSAEANVRPMALGIWGLPTFLPRAIRQASARWAPGPHSVCSFGHYQHAAAARFVADSLVVFVVKDTHTNSSADLSFRRLGQKIRHLIRKALYVLPQNRVHRFDGLLCHWVAKAESLNSACRTQIVNARVEGDRGGERPEPGHYSRD